MRRRPPQNAAEGRAALDEYIDNLRSTHASYTAAGDSEAAESVSLLLAAMGEQQPTQTRNGAAMATPHPMTWNSASSRLAEAHQRGDRHAAEALIADCSEQAKVDNTSKAGAIARDLQDRHAAWLNTPAPPPPAKFEWPPCAVYGQPEYVDLTDGGQARATAMVAAVRNAWVVGKTGWCWQLLAKLDENAKTHRRGAIDIEYLRRGGHGREVDYGATTSAKEHAASAVAAQLIVDVVRAELGKLTALVAS